VVEPAGPMTGVRVLEVASHVFVPIAAAVLAEWGADIVKVEHPETGDAYRGLVTAGLHTTHGGVDPSWQFTNRGKRSVSIDLKVPEGRALLYRLAATSDVLLTSFRPDARRRLAIDLDDVRAHNPAIIYVRGSGFGARGPDAERGGYDSAAYFCRTGMAHVLTAAGADWPVGPRPAFGDVVGGLTIAGAISAALFRRATTGEPSVIDVSLMGTGMWQLQADITHAGIEASGGGPGVAMPRDRFETWNPAVGTYRTRDGRFLSLVMLDADRYWADLCSVIGHPELASDPRYADMPARRANSRACVEALDAAFAERDYDDWCRILGAAKGVWTPIQTPAEIHRDAQARANGYLADVDMANGTTLTMVTSPVQFDERPGAPTRAPELGEHTEEVLLELGLSWDDISALRRRRAI
jgi:crotonobetainyl-CoA:carnitine CoA-transferase CaiB-like acyl-CoA transferase